MNMMTVCAAPFEPATFAERVEAACDAACAAIAPAWPLDRSIAVNPHWQRIGLPLRSVAARMAVLGAIQVFPARARMREAWESGRISAADLRDALAAAPAAGAAGLTVDDCVAALRQAHGVARIALLIDLLDDDPQGQHRLCWRDAVTHQVSQACAAWFDRSQADWQPGRGEGLYAFWRDSLRHDHGIGVLMGLPELGRVLDALPATAAEAERWVLARLDLAPEVWADYLEAVLLTVNGWASWCAWLGWQARLAGTSDAHLRDLLAIRLAWGVLLLESTPAATSAAAFAAARAAWRDLPALLKRAEQALLADEVWQTALEAGYQRELASRVSRGPGAAPHAQAPQVQAAFCIDVRSEPLRRAVEAVWPAVQTIGCAGFFGLPVAYTPLGTRATTPRLPGLLAPTMNVAERVWSPSGAQADIAAARARRQHLAVAAQVDAGSRWPGAAFSFVEAAGLAYVGKLWQWVRPTSRRPVRPELAGLPARYRRHVRPQLVGLERDDKATLAGKVLRGMGLTAGFAPLVLLVGHGSQSANNAHAAGLECGACGGHSGEVNARALAALLNEPEVREDLAAQGLPIAAHTWFLAALHNTTTDEVEAFDLDLAPAEAQARWTRLQPVLAQAGSQVRRARAGRLEYDPRAGERALLDHFRRRANDGAQTRPEWGLAGNAAFIIAARSRTVGLDLDGRGFLHDYDPASDPDGAWLEQIMTAPMLVTHWINWQYHASTCEPQRLGSGNKLLHNVVGGHIGVFEGNGGDLRVGLPRQSLHDGQRWVHEPLRLTVVIDAPAASIERVLARHAVVRQLVDNGWLHLWRIGTDGMQGRAGGAWRRLPSSWTGAA